MNKEGDISSAKQAVAITGASGLIGRALGEALAARGHTVKALRRPSDWSIDGVKEGVLVGVDTVVHLAGEPVFGRWSEAKKQRIRDSRVLGTQAVAAACARDGVKALVSASAIGFYGSAGEAADESAGAGEGFFAEVGLAWEQAADAAREAGVRVAHPRIGIVLAKEGGALKMMLPVFGLGLGGRLGSGQQWMSWITLGDLVRTLVWMVEGEVDGPVNLTAGAVRNSAFTKTLGRVLRRPTLLPVPGFAMRLVFRGLADEALLGGRAVEPGVLREAGFAFEAEDLEAGLRLVLEKPA